MLHTTKYMHQILDLSLDAYEELFKEIDITNLVDRKGIIYVWTNENLKSRNMEIKVREELGIKQTLLKKQEILDLEPNLNRCLMVIYFMITPIMLGIQKEY